MKKPRYSIYCPGGIRDYSLALLIIKEQLNLRTYTDLKKLRIRYDKDKTKDKKNPGFSFSFITNSEIDFSPLERAGLTINSP